MRVKKIMIDDKWSAISGSDAISQSYGQAYDYTTSDINGKTISSGSCRLRTVSVMMRIR